MSAETEFHTALLAHGPLVALVGQRIALHAVPPDTALPYIVYSATHAPEYTLDGTLVVDNVTFEVQCWAGAALAAQDVAAAAQAAVKAAGATVLSQAGAYDAEVGLDAVQLSVEWLE